MKPATPDIRDCSDPSIAAYRRGCRCPACRAANNERTRLSVREGRPQGATADLMQRILRRLMIPAASYSTRRDLAEALEVPISQVRTALLKLEERGQVMRSTGSSRYTRYARPDYSRVREEQERDQAPAPDDASRPTVAPADAPPSSIASSHADAPGGECRLCAFTRRLLSDAQRDAARYHEMLTEAKIPVMPLPSDNPASPSYRAPARVARSLQQDPPAPLAAELAQIFTAPANAPPAGVAPPPAFDFDMSEHVVLVPGYAPTAADLEADAWEASRAERLAAEHRGPDGYCLGCDEKVGHPAWCPYAPADLRTAADPSDW